MFSSLSVITLVPYQLNRLCVCACVCNFCDKAVGNGTFDTKRMLQFSSVKCTLWLKFGFRVVLPSRPVPSSPIQLKKEKGNGTILIMFAEGCSCISDPSVCRQQRVCSNFITKPSSTEEQMFYWRWWTTRLKYYIGTINSSFLSLAVTKPKEKLL